MGENIISFFSSTWEDDKWCHIVERVLGNDFSEEYEMMINDIVNKKHGVVRKKRYKIGYTKIINNNNKYYF